MLLTIGRLNLELAPPRLYAIAYSADVAPPTGVQVVQGLQSDGSPAAWADDVLSPTESGTFDWPTLTSGLQEGVRYRIAIVRWDRQTLSNVANTDAFLGLTPQAEAGAAADAATSGRTIAAQALHHAPADDTASTTANLLTPHTEQGNGQDTGVPTMVTWQSLSEPALATDLALRQYFKKLRQAQTLEEVVADLDFTLPTLSLRDPALAMQARTTQPQLSVSFRACEVVVRSSEIVVTADVRLPEMTVN